MGPEAVFSELEGIDWSTELVLLPQLLRDRGLLLRACKPLRESGELHEFLLAGSSEEEGGERLSLFWIRGPFATGPRFYPGGVRADYGKKVWCLAGECEVSGCRSPHRIGAGQVVEYPRDICHRVNVPQRWTALVHEPHGSRAV